MSVNTFFMLKREGNTSNHDLVSRVGQWNKDHVELKILVNVPIQLPRGCSTSVDYEQLTTSSKDMTQTIMTRILLQGPRKSLKTAS